MKKQAFIISIGLLCGLSAIAQNDIDAMRYSQLTFGGTARFASMAGSMGALGGDISTLSFNPAGIAVFKKTELTITPSIFSQTTSSTYLGNTSSDSRLNFNLGNIGLVATFNLDDKKNTSGWQSLNFGFGYNRTNNFYNRMSIAGDNRKSSLLDTYVANANGHPSTDFDQFSTDLAWQTYLINPDTSGNLLYNHVIPHYGERQTESVETKGSMGETVVSFGGDYKEKVFIGATVGIVNAKYITESIYTETDETDTINNFKSFTYTQDLTTKGTGINLKVGVIVKPNDWLRLGVAFHTPTSIRLHDDYSNAMSSDLDNGIGYDTVSPKGSFDYRIVTPYRAIGSVGFVIKKIALLNVDYEYTDYTYAQLHSHPDNIFSDVNSTIRSKYTATGNLRVGGEIRFDPWAFRLGYALYGSPFRNGENQDADRTSYTAGVGFRTDKYFIDFAYILTKYTEYDYLYDPSISTSVKNDYKMSSFMLTFGVRF